MKLELELNEALADRLAACAKHRNVPINALALAYLEDWVHLEYAELNGHLSRRHLYRDGPIAFDPEAAEAAARVEEDLRRSGNG